MLQLPCPHCKKMVVSDDGLRFPPWCRKCGATLKLKPEELANATPAPTGDVRRIPTLLNPTPPANYPSCGLTAPPTAKKQPICFNGRAASGEGRLYRIYLCETEMMFLDRTPWQAPQVASAVASIVGGVLGKLAFDAALSGEKERTAARHSEMDLADEFHLQIMADEDTHSFRAAITDLEEVRVDAAKGWQRWGLWGQACAGVLSFRHRGSKPVKVELPEAEDLRRAMLHLPEFLGDRVMINVVWDSHKQCHVRVV